MSCSCLGAFIFYVLLISLFLCLSFFIPLHSSYVCLSRLHVVVHDRNFPLQPFAVSVSLFSRTWHTFFSFFFFLFLRLFLLYLSIKCSISNDLIKRLYLPFLFCNGQRLVHPLSPHRQCSRVIRPSFSISFLRSCPSFFFMVLFKEQKSFSRALVCFIASPPSLTLYRKVY